VEISQIFVFVFVFFLSNNCNVSIKNYLRVHICVQLGFVNTSKFCG